MTKGYHIGTAQGGGRVREEKKRDSAVTNEIAVEAKRKQKPKRGSFSRKRDQ